MQLHFIYIYVNIDILYFLYVVVFCLIFLDVIQQQVNSMAEQKSVLAHELSVTEAKLAPLPTTSSIMEQNIGTYMQI